MDDFMEQVQFEAFAAALIQAKEQRMREITDVLCFDSDSLEWSVAVPGVSEKAYCAAHNVWLSRRVGQEGCGIKRSPDMDTNLSWSGVKKALDVERAMRLLSIDAFELWAAPMTQEDAAFAIEWVHRDQYL